MKYTGVARKYFTEANATRIDGIRLRIAAWRAGGEIRPTEERLLLADLLLAVNSVANIAGTYGCFLSYWSTQSQMPLALRPRTLFPHRVKVQASVSDVADVQVTPQDLVYLDPAVHKAAVCRLLPYPRDYNCRRRAIRQWHHRSPAMATQGV